MFESAAHMEYVVSMFYKMLAMRPFITLCDEDCTICGVCGKRGDHCFDYTDDCTTVWCDHCDLTYVCACHTLSQHGRRCCCEQVSTMTRARVVQLLQTHYGDHNELAMHLAQRWSDTPEDEVDVIIFWCLRLTVNLHLHERDEFHALHIGNTDAFCERFSNRDEQISTILPRLAKPVLGVAKDDCDQCFVGTCCNCGTEHWAIIGAD